MTDRAQEIRDDLARSVKYEIQRNGSRLDNLRLSVQEAGLYLTTRGGLGGPMRYRFASDDSGYFESDGLFVALGISEAETWINGYLKGKASR